MYYEFKFHYKLKNNVWYCLDETLNSPVEAPLCWIILMLCPPLQPSLALLEPLVWQTIPMQCFSWLHLHQNSFPLKVSLPRFQWPSASSWYHPGRNENLVLLKFLVGSKQKIFQPFLPCFGAFTFCHKHNRNVATCWYSWFQAHNPRALASRTNRGTTYEWRPLEDAGWCCLLQHIFCANVTAFFVVVAIVSPLHVHFMQITQKVV